MRKKKSTQTNQPGYARQLGFDLSSESPKYYKANLKPGLISCPCHVHHKIAPERLTNHLIFHCSAYVIYINICVENDE